MKKKLLAMLMAAVLSLSLLAGCGGTASSTPSGSSSASGSTAGEEPYTVTMMFVGDAQDDEAKIEEAINALTVPDLNMKLDILMVPFASAAEQIRLMLSGGEKLDLMMALAAQIPTYVATQSVYDLSELIDQYGTNIKEAMGEDAKVANVNGYVYGVPNATNWFTQTSIMMRTDWLEEAGFTAEDIKTIEDLEKVYAEVQKNHPEAAMLAMKNSNTYDAGWSTTDALLDSWGVLLNYGEKPEVVNWYATDEFKALVERQYRWAQNGWISKDAATTTDTLDSQIGAGKAFSQVSLLHPTIVSEATQNIGTPVTVVPLYEMYTTSSLTTPICWTIARNSKEPEKAMQMLDYIYGSPEVANLLNWGIEGEHYVVTDEGTAAYPEGMDRTNDPYHANLAYRLPNQFIAHVWEGVPVDAFEETARMNEEAKRSCAYGFTYDGSAFTNEIAALNNVKGQYLDALVTGAVKPDDVLPQFLQALEDAGINKIIEAKQAQLDAWMAQQ